MFWKLRIFLASLAFVSAFSAAHAQDRLVTWALQARLTQDKLYDGEMDGLSGPATRAAIEIYANNNGIQPSRSAVVEHIMYRSLTSDRRSPTEQELLAARDAARYIMRDAEAAQFRDEWAFDAPGGVLICGQVNGKNVYGAYVGFRAYSLTLSVLSIPGNSDPTLIPLGEPNMDNAGVFCSLGTSIGLAIISRSNSHN
ncbi:MAG: hypothetical protein WD046_07645 [Paracoccaceae bacterium]